MSRLLVFVLDNFVSLFNCCKCKLNVNYVVKNCHSIVKSELISYPVAGTARYLVVGREYDKYMYKQKQINFARVL